MAKVHLSSRHAQCAQTKNEKGQTEEEVTDITILLQIDEHDTQEECRIDHIGNVERHTCRHNPGRQRRTDVGTHDNRNGLRQREQSRIHKRDGHHRGCR